MSDLETGVLVLGAGLQGAGVALELAARGISVTLLERDAVAVNRASLRNEGKIHLGLIYANDPSLGTALLQLEGALRFRSILGRWLGANAGWLSTSTPFHYLVARDSLLAPDALAAHYRAVEAGCRERLGEDSALDYLGARPDRLFWPLTDAELAAHFDRPGSRPGSRPPSSRSTPRFWLRRCVGRSPSILVSPSGAALRRA